MNKKSMFTIALILSGALLFYFLFASRTSIDETSGTSEQVKRTGQKILYWVDPMHPSYKTDKPGIAPDC